MSGEIRCTYVLEDFSRWDDAIHQAVDSFRGDFDCTPNILLVSPQALRRMSETASGDRVLDSNGEPPPPGEQPTFEEFTGTDYVLSIRLDAVWPVELVLIHQPDIDAEVPDEDTDIELGSLGLLTRMSHPILAWPPNRRPPLRFLAEQCCACSRLRTFTTCDAFETMIPRDIAQGRHDHRERYPGDDGRVFDLHADADRRLDAILAWMTGDDAPLK